jgi:hypothetical protein
VQSARMVITGGLQGIGNGSGDLAEFMENLVCLGKPLDPINNPVTVWLRKLGVREPMVTFSIDGYFAETSAYGRRVSVPLPDTLQVFMARFDAGAYPQLISKGAIA